MNDFEQTLTKVIDHFISLQRWSTKPESTRNPVSVYSIIIAIDRGLKKMRKADKNDPLQELAREVQAAFDTKEFRAVLLAAFNWRSASRRAATEPIQGKANRVSNNLETTRSKRRSTQHASPAGPFDQIHLPRYTEEQINRDAENTKKFFENFKSFIDNIPAKTMKRLAVPDRHVDIYQAGRRLDGSYGANQ